MSHYDKTKLVSLITGLFLIATPISSFSAQGTLDLEFYEQFVSAKIDGVSLETILTEISKKKGIWFKVDESVLQKPITAEFTDLSLQDGLRRILLNMNYAFTFDSNNRIVGIFVAGKEIGKPGTTWGNYTVSKMNITGEEAFAEQTYIHTGEEGIPEEISNGIAEQALEEEEEAPDLSAIQKESNSQANQEEVGVDTELPFLPDDYQDE